MNGNNGLLPDYFRDTERAERECRSIEQGIAEAEERLRQLEARHSSFFTVVYNHFTGIPGMPSASDRLHSRQQAYQKLNQALNPYWLPEVLSLRSEWQWSRRWDKYREPWNPEYPPAKWQSGSLVVQSVEQMTCQRTAVFNLLCVGRHGSYFQDYSVPFSFEGRVERYIPTGDVGMSRLEMELRAASDLARRQLDRRCAGYLDELIQAVLPLVLPLRQQVVLTFHPDLGPAEGEEQLRIHGCDYRHIRLINEKNKKFIKSHLTWPPLTKYEPPKIGERYGLASYKGICWVCHGHWEPHRFPQETLTRVWDGIEKIARPLLEQLAESARKIALCRQEIALLRRRGETLAILYLHPPLISREEWNVVEKRRAASGSGASVNNQLQVPQDAASLRGREP